MPTMDPSRAGIVPSLSCVPCRARQLWFGMRTGKCRLKLLDTSLPLSEQLLIKLKGLTIASVGEDVEQLDHTYTSDGNAKTF